MSLPVKTEASIERFAKRVSSGRETQRAIGASMGWGPTATSSVIRALREWGVPIETQPHIRKATKPKATTKTVIASKATRKRANGLHAH
jgi:biotin operon repressor